MKLGNNDITLKLGNTDVSAAYLGTELVYSASTPSHDYSQDYFTFRALEDGTFQFSQTGLSYSLDDGTTWTSLAAATSTPTVQSGTTILWKGTRTPSQYSGIGTFSSTGAFDIEGNAMSLLFGDNFSGRTDLTGRNYAFYKLFSGSTTVHSAENMILPATTLSNYCYYYMFANCTSLTTAPELLAPTLATSSYNRMFFGCSNLNYIKCLAVNKSASDSTNYWTYGVASSGTFIKDANTSWPSGENGIPQNWSVIDG